MSTLYGNLTQLVEQPGGKIKYDKYGMATLSTDYACQASLVGVLAPAPFAAHPTYQSLQNDVEQMEISFDDDNDKVAIISCKYSGLMYSVNAIPPTYELLLGTNQDPIETHPDFVSSLGGTKNAPLNSCQFNADGTFKGFPPNANANLGGVRYYLVPAITWKESSIAQLPTWNLSSIGKTWPTDPPGNPPTLPSGNWIFIGATQTRQGGCYKRTREWRASMPLPWNALIYATAVP